jgi:formate-nitrite transporter family protein
MIQPAILLVSLEVTCLFYPTPEERAPLGDLKSAGEILETVVDDGNEELSRTSAGLVFSGLAAGLNISFSAVAVMGGVLAGWVGLAAALLHPIGFLIVVLGRSQLYTKNTVAPVAVVLQLRPPARHALALGSDLRRQCPRRNAVRVHGDLRGGGAAPRLAGLVRRGRREAGSRILEYDPQCRRRGLAGALMAWLAASRDTIFQAVVIYVLVYLIPAGGAVLLCSRLF